MKTRKLLVSGGRVLTPDGVKTADVLVEDDRIARVSSRLSSLGDAKVVDATGHVVVPGLVQARTALAHTSLRGLARPRWQRVSGAAVAFARRCSSATLAPRHGPERASARV
jgi:dihydroorotase-like cyclic amidohydrolase